VVRRSLAVVLVSVLLAVGCAGATPESDEGVGGTTDTAQAPLVGSGTDSADRACNVVLRALGRVSNDMGGYKTHCANGSCYYVWEGTLQLSDEAAASGTPAVLFQSGSDPTWWTGTVTALAPADGTHLYAVALDEHTVTDGLSLSSLMHTRIQVAPALVLADGSRLFDHNRNPGDFDNYVLDASDGWSVRDDPAVCPAAPPKATLRFASDWSEVQYGAIVASGELTVDYDGPRLPQCASSADRAITGSARFTPGGESVSATVLSLAGGVPTKALWTIDVPAVATGVELWFSTTGTGCETAWDSNFGSNYSFAVASAPPSAEVSWAGDWGSMASRGCLDGDRQDGVAEPWVFDSWVLTQAICTWAEVDVYAAGLTDGASEHPELLLAQVVYSLDGGEAQTGWLGYQGRVGNNYRYRWDIAHSGIDLVNVPWDSVTWALRFSTDGNHWFQVAQGDGPSGGSSRTIAHGAD
jgi:hypothetical protein